MNDHAPTTSTEVTNPTTFDAFYADRESFWHSWTKFAFGVGGFIVLVLILMRFFLV
jgi:hypothetical protein